MTRDELVRKLRSLRRLERSIRGLTERDRTEVWERYFSLTEGARVRYPFRMLQVFDRASRERAFNDYLLGLWAHSTEVEAVAHDAELLAMLGLPPEADAAAVRSAFRTMARELHPDLGGDDDLMRELIAKYRVSSFGGKG